MLSYQHQYHAGNHADVLKHWLLIECVKYLQKKDKPFDYIDTHAGAGMYGLNSVEALKTGESRAGVLKLDWPNLKGFEEYHALVAKDLAQARYPGSPELVNRLLREGDHSWLFELHPQTLQELQRHCQTQRKTYVKQQDGFQGLLSLLPTKSRRALVLIDPSYEIKSDYQTVVQILAKAYQKMPQVMALLWYPVVDRSFISAMEREIKKTAMRNVQLFELCVAADEAKGMTGSGLIALNPPWLLAESFERVIPAVAKMLAQSESHQWRWVELIPE
ncbi:23S rRNA (adenine2030-N6)-methyltransferase [Alteromonadaceae bacterium Bs31]|nr:23S rRNA (adenine2030-N6)-methyltransferase [Alteromonadaceae bacterium Bs31]